MNADSWHDEIRRLAAASEAEIERRLAALESDPEAAAALEQALRGSDFTPTREAIRSAHAAARRRLLLECSPAEAPARRPLRPWIMRIAASVALLLTGTWMLHLYEDQPLPETPLDQPMGGRSSFGAADLQQAMADASRVLGLTSMALRRVEQAAVRDVLGRQIAPTLRRIPIPGGLGPAEREDGA